VGIGISQLRNAQPKRGWLRGRLVPAFCVISFFCLLFVFDNDWACMSPRTIYASSGIFSITVNPWNVDRQFSNCYKASWRKREICDPVANDSPIFTSGRLQSVDAIQVAVFLEQHYASTSLPSVSIRTKLTP